jgi:serine/threonine-protein kinase
VRVGVYEIVASLGAGGMGEVYRARDTKLDRLVALKILPESFAQDPDRLARFHREARTLAALNHPNIAIIHGAEEADRVHALVMELVEGEDLSQRLARGPLPLDDALAIAKQVADALDAAHEQGVVHRDLKPANIKVRSDGTAKVLDFGLAKAVSPPVAGGTATASPTITSPALLTGVGMLLGTAAYMSPEQAKGRQADQRSDVWAFGCVLYEMLTGARAFPGDDVSDTLAAILRAEPHWQALPATTPLPVRRLLRRCLEKDRKRRLAAIADARLDIEDALSASSPDSTASTAPGARTRRWLPWLAAGVALVVGGSVAGAAVWLATRPGAERLTRTTIQTSGEMALVGSPVSRNFAIARDGSKIVYRAATQLVVRPLAQLEATALKGAGAGNAPFFAPDGQWIGFFENSALKKVAISGGPPITLFQGNGGASGATWGSDSTIVFAQTGARGLRRISAEGGDAAFVTTVDQTAGELNHTWPDFLPDSRSVLFTIVRAGDVDTSRDVALLDLATGNRTVLIPGGSHPRYLPTGHIVYGTTDTLFAVPFDLERRTVSGNAVPVVAPVAAIGGAAGYQYDVAHDGTLVYQPDGSTARRSGALVWVDRQGRETALGVQTRPFIHPRLAPDGTRVVVNIEGDLWVWEIAGKRLVRATFEPRRNSTPLWSPDSQYLVFGSTRRGGPANLFMQAANNTGVATQLVESPNVNQPTAFTPDGLQIVFNENTPARQRDIRLLTLKPTPRVTSLVETRFDERGGIVSPNGRWLAYESNSSGSYEIFVRPFPGVDSGLWQVSTSGGVQPLWARSGRELFYIAPDGLLMAVPLQAHESVWLADAPVPAVERPYYRGGEGTFSRQYDVSGDGQRFLMIKEEPTEVEAAPSIVVVRPWFDELKRLTLGR